MSDDRHWRVRCRTVLVRVSNDRRAFCVDAVWSIFFFFSSRRRHTRLQGDWSSDVCSSDLKTSAFLIAAHRPNWLVSFPREVNCFEAIGDPIGIAPSRSLTVCGYLGEKRRRAKITSIGQADLPAGCSRKLGG